MSLQTRLSALITAIGADIKALQVAYGTSGLRANRPLFGTYELQRYFATDQAAEYLWIGSSWIRTSIPPGVEADFPAAEGSIPTGWEPLYGQNLLRTGKYIDLYNLLGNTYGNPGDPYFTVPDSRGRVVAGKDNMGGVGAGQIAAATTLTHVGGVSTVALTTAQMPSHSHLLGPATNSTDGGGFGASPDWYRSGNVQGPSTGRPNAGSTGSQGSGTAHDNKQPYRTANRIIKL